MPKQTKIRMIVLDLDRTLLRSDKSLSEYSVSVLGRCRERGIRVVYATARPARAVTQYRCLFEPDALIWHNGALVLVGGRLVRYGIGIGEVHRIVADIGRLVPDAKLSVEIDDVLYADFDVSIYWDNCPVRLTDFSDLPEIDADKIIIGISSPDQLEKIAAILPCDVYIEMSDGKLGLIMSRGASKFKGIMAIAAELGIDINEVAAFGDDFNDLEMLSGCGVGVAPANATPEARAAAGFISASNDEDGPARWIDDNVL